MRIAPPVFLIFIFAATLALLTWLLREPLFAEWRRARIRRQPFPVEWRQILRTRVPYFRTLPADLQLQLKKRMQVFLAEKPFIGCAGLVVTDEMRVTIAAQACLLILNRRTDHFANLRQVLVYPGAFVVDKVRADGAGVSHERRDALAGESWSLGQVVLSWQDTLDGASVIDDGRNVVIHEFAHQLDQANGAANGAPQLPSRARRARWQRVLGAEFQALQRRVSAGEESLLSDYGAVDPAEFFAVASEVFFEQPARLAAEHATLYRELSGFYRVNPLSW
ncbi:MAG: M90 family metallopeptidase [Burkholderiales bacterium]